MVAAGPRTGPSQIRLLAPDRAVRPRVLEATTVEVRKQRADSPARHPLGDLRWRPSTPARTPQSTAPGRAVPPPTAHPVRGDAGARRCKLTHGVLLADEAHRSLAKGSRRPGSPTSAASRSWAPGSGHRSQARPLDPVSGAGECEPVRSVSSCGRAGRAEPRGSRCDSSACARCPGKAGRRRRRVRGARVSPRCELLFQAAGQVEQVAPELCGPARRLAQP